MLDVSFEHVCALPQQRWRIIFLLRLSAPHVQSNRGRSFVGARAGREKAGPARIGGLPDRPEIDRVLVPSVPPAVEEMNANAAADRDARRARGIAERPRAG